MIKKWSIIALLGILMVAGVVLFYAALIELSLLIIILTGSSILIGLNVSELNQVKQKEIQKLIKTAEELYNDNQLNNALKTFQRILRIDQSSYEAILGMAQCRRMLLEYEKALEDYKKASELKPDRHEAFFFMGMTLLQSNRLEDALCSFKKVESIRDDLEDLPYLLGEIHEKLGDCEKAFNCYRKYLETCTECKMRLGIIGKMEALQQRFSCDEQQKIKAVLPSSAQPEKADSGLLRKIPENISLSADSAGEIETEYSYDEYEPQEPLPGVTYKNSGDEKKQEKAPAGPKAAARLLGISQKRTPVMLNLEVQIGNAPVKEKYVKPTVTENPDEAQRKVILNLSPEAVGMDMIKKALEEKIAKNRTESPEESNTPASSDTVTEKKELRRPSISI